MYLLINCYLQNDTNDNNSGNNNKIIISMTRIIFIYENKQYDAGDNKLINLE